MEQVTQLGIKYVPYLDALRALHCSKYWLEDQINQGKLKKYRVNRKVYLSVAEINKMIESEAELESVA